MRPGAEALAAAPAAGDLARSSPNDIISVWPNSDWYRSLVWEM